MGGFSIIKRRLLLAVRVLFGFLFCFFYLRGIGWFSGYRGFYW